MWNYDDDYKNKYEDYDDDYDDDYRNEYEYENRDDETMSQNKIKDLNDNLDETIDKSKSFEEQIELLKKLEGLKEYLFMKDFDDKKLKFKIFKLKLADLSNEIDEKLFEEIFGHKLIKLADGLINTKTKEKKQIIVNEICRNKNKPLEMDDLMIG